jgi:biotin-dependent carboxylase-like uncharacterized protein
MRQRQVSVLDAGPLTTVQDRGRTGWAHLGVPRAGALDVPAAELGNRLVGNPPEAAVLEATLGGVTVRVSAAMAVAVTGAPASVEVDGRAVAFGEAVAVPAGATVRVGPATVGLRSYLALAGGVAVEPVLGSRSTDTLAGVGPARVQEGDVLPVGPAAGPPGAVDVPAVRRVARPGTVAELRFAPGPRVNWFDTDAVRTLTGTPYTVTAASNRIGLRLDGPALPRARTEELPSEGIVLGAIQVPASGQPLVFLNDHPTTGGYPVIGVVLADDLPVCAQLRPGEQVRFRLS